MALENNQIVNSSIDNDEISLKELIIKIKEWASFFKSKWKIIFFAGIVGGIIGFTISVYDKPTYKASLTFAMEEDKGTGGGGLSGALGLASSFGIDLGGGGGGGAFAASNLAELMKSRLLVERVLFSPIEIKEENTTLLEYYIQINELRKNSKFKNISFLQGIDRSKFTRQQDSVIQQIYKSLISKESLSIMQKDKKISILTIEVTSNDEIFSKLFCESLAQMTSDYYIETKSKKAKLNVDILGKQVENVQLALNSAITGTALEVDNVFNLNPAFNIKGAKSKKGQIDVQSNTAILSNLLVQLELAKITLRKETPLIQFIDRPILPLEKNRLGKIKSLTFGSAFAVFISIFVFIIINLYKKMKI
jgi:uncharacterized protein involved in exopolysaccharide biosynthesis